MRVFLVRHGETEMNQRGCYYGCTDVHLTDRGRSQARQLSRFFQKQSISQVICSPLTRAVSTAEIIMEGRQISYVLEDRLSEQNFGIFEGGTYEELKERYNEEWKKWEKDYYGYRIPGGESFLDVRKRTEAFLNELMEKKPDTVLLVAHKGTLGHFLAASLQLPPQGYWNFTLEQGCYSCVDFEDGYAIIRKLNQSVG